MPGKLEGRGSAYDLGHDTTLAFYRDENGDVSVGIEHHVGTSTQETCTAVLYFDPPGPVAEGEPAYTLTQVDPPTIEQRVECPNCAHAGDITDGVFFPA